MWEKTISHPNKRSIVASSCLLPYSIVRIITASAWFIPSTLTTCCQLSNDVHDNDSKRAMANKPNILFVLHLFSRRRMIKKNWFKQFRWQQLWMPRKVDCYWFISTILLETDDIVIQRIRQWKRIYSIEPDECDLWGNALYSDEWIRRFGKRTQNKEIWK